MSGASAISWPRNRLLHDRHAVESSVVLERLAVNGVQVLRQRIQREKPHVCHLVAISRELPGPCPDQEGDRKGLNLVSVRIRHAEPWVGVDAEQLGALDGEPGLFMNLPGQCVKHRVTHIDDPRREAPMAGVGPPLKQYTSLVIDEDAAHTWYDRFACDDSGAQFLM